MIRTRYTTSYMFATSDGHSTCTPITTASIALDESIMYLVKGNKEFFSH